MVGWLNERKIPLICAGPVADRLPGHIDLFGSEQFATVTRVGKEGRQFGRYVVQPFRVPHDSRGGCYGFRLEPAEGGRPVVVCTDLAEAGDHLVRHFAGAAVIVLESNHDPGLLQASARPMWLKRRIRERGHLSNEECAAFLVKVLREGGGAPPTIVLAHLSQECNTEEAALGVTRNALREAGFTGVRVLASHPFEPSDVVAG
jgi:phosphoribosyl 1,2-cyclic phosphodiesterase